MKLRSVLLTLFVCLLVAGTQAHAQWQTPNHTVPIGRGPGVTGFNSAAPGVSGNCLVSNGSGSNPSFQACPGDAINPMNPPYNAVCGNTGTDDHTALQNAINDGISLKRSVFIPSICATGSPLEIASGVRIFGNTSAGHSGTGSYISALNATQGMIHITTTDSVVIENLGFSSFVTKTGGYGIKMDMTPGVDNFHSVFNNLNFEGIWGAMDLTNAAYWRVSNSTFSGLSGASTHLLVNITTPMDDSGSNVVTGNLFSGTGTIAIDHQGGGGLAISNNYFLQGDTAIYERGASNFGGLTITGNIFDAQAVVGIRVQPQTGFINGEIAITGNVVDTGIGTSGWLTMQKGGSGSDIVRAAVVGNSINAFNRPAITIVDCTNCNISTNVINGSLAGMVTIGANVLNSVVSNNIIDGGGTIVNGSTTTLVVATETAVPKLRVAGQLEVQSFLVLDGATSGFLTITPALAAGSSHLVLPGGSTDFSATGGTSQVVKQVGVGAAFTVARLACSDLSDAGSGCTGTSSSGGTVTNVGTTGPIGGGPITTTGSITCSTCVISSAALTVNQLVIGQGLQASATLGSLGTTTTVLHGNASGAPSFGPVVSADLNITTTSCTSQFVTAISSGGVGTCTTATLASAQYANQGTTSTVLHGNGSGNPSFGAVALGTDVSGTLPVANGGTGLTAGTSGGVLAYTATGTLASSAALAANAIVVGGGASVVPLTPATTPATISSTGVLTVVNATDASAIGTASTVVTGGLSVAKKGIFGDAVTITSASATSLVVGLNGATNPAFTIDDSTASSATGFKIKSAAAAGGLALSVTTSGTNENLTFNAAGSGTITLGSVSTGAIVHTRATTLSAALTYGGVTLSNAVTGTGNMVLSASPTFTGTVLGATDTWSGLTTSAGFTVTTSAAPGPLSIWTDGTALIYAGGGGGHQFNNSTNTVALFNISNAGGLTILGTPGVSCPSGISAVTSRSVNGIITAC